MHSAPFASPVGMLTIHCSDEHVHSILFTSEEITEKMSEPAHPLLKTCYQQLKEYFEGKRKRFDLPLKQQGTAFQEKVWEQFQKIPYGKPISYLELAGRIGDVKPSEPLVWLMEEIILLLLFLVTG